MKQRKRWIICFLALGILAILAGAFYFQGSRTRVIHFEPAATNTYRFTFEIANIPFLAQKRRLPFGISGSAYVPDTYLYVFADGRRVSARGAEVFSYSTATNRIRDLQVQKPLAEAGSWNFQVHRRITDFYYLPFATLSVGPREEIWMSRVFTNAFRPTDVHPLSEENPFE